MSKSFCFMVFVIVGLAVGGCAHTHSAVGFRGIQSKNLVFNPEWTRTPFVAVSRDSDWPSARADSGADERIEFRETIIDYQGRSSGANDDRYYRRLYSVRERGARR